MKSQLPVSFTVTSPRPNYPITWRGWNYSIAGFTSRTCNWVYVLVTSRTNKIKTSEPWWLNIFIYIQRGFYFLNYKLFKRWVRDLLRADTSLSFVIRLCGHLIIIKEPCRCLGESWEHTKGLVTIILNDLAFVKLFIGTDESFITTYVAN